MAARTWLNDYSSPERRRVAVMRCNTQGRSSRYRVAEAFVQRQSARGSNIFSDGAEIFSYGTHFPMAGHQEDGVIWVNPDRYSVTTSKHQSALKDVLLANGYRPAARDDERFKNFSNPAEFWTS